MSNHATQKQREEIKRVGKIAFKGEITGDAFLVFSSWLQQKHSLFQLEDISFIMAPKVIEDLREMANITNHLQHGISIDYAAALYLRGIKQGQKHRDKSPPSIEKVIENIKKEIEER